MKRKTNTITEKHPVVVPLVGRFIHADLSIKKGQIFLVGTAKGQVEYSKLLFTTFHSRITIPVSSASNSFRTEQFCSEALQFSSCAGDINLPYELRRVREHTHTLTRPRIVSRALDIYTSIYIYTRDARVSQSTRWCIEEARAIKRHVLRGCSEREGEKRRREINR